MFNEDEVVDVTNWDSPSEYLQGTRHPKGRQDKHILINPQNSKKYFFKDTWRKRENNYQEVVKHQFWCEYIATKIGESMGLDVPKCYIAISSSEETDFGVGVLSEWYLRPLEQEISGKDILSGSIEKYIDGYLSKSENNNKYYTLQNILEHTKDINPDYLQFWFKFFLFDALIGNTDRHDENWGVIKHTSSTCFTPIYDNGISLGWRESEESLESFNYEKFFNGFRHKIRLSEDSSNKTYAKPKDVISHFVSLNPDFKELGYDFIKSYKHEDLDRIIQIIENNLNPQIQESYRLSKIRSKFILDFVTHRYRKLMELLK